MYKVNKFTCKYNAVTKKKEKKRRKVEIRQVMLYNVHMMYIALHILASLPLYISMDY